MLLIEAGKFGRRVDLLGKMMFCSGHLEFLISLSLKCSIDVDVGLEPRRETEVREIDLGSHLHRDNN